MVLAPFNPISIVKNLSVHDMIKKIILENRINLRHENAVVSYVRHHFTNK